MEKVKMIRKHLKKPRHPLRIVINEFILSFAQTYEMCLTKSEEEDIPLEQVA